MKVLLVAINFPPLNKIGSRRILAFANDLSELGHDVTVLTTKKTQIDGRLDYRPHISSKINLIETDMFKESSLPSAASDSPSSVIRGLRRLNRAVRWNILGSLLHPYDLWKKKLRSSNILDRLDHFDIGIASYGPAAPVYVLSWLKRKGKVEKAILDYRDLWSNIASEDLIWPFNIIQEKVEKHFIKQYSAAITVSNGFKRRLIDLHGRDFPVHVIHNGYEAEDYLIEDEIEGVYSKSNFTKFPKLYYIGTLNPYHRNPLPLIKAVQGMLNKGRKFQLKFFGQGDEYFKSNNNGDYFGGVLSAAAAREKVNEADILVLIENASGNNDGVLTAKVYEYIASGKPILCIGVQAGSELYELLEKYGRVIFVQQNETIAISKAIDEFDSLMKKRPNVRFVRQFSRKNQSKKLFNLMKLL